MEMTYIHNKTGIIPFKLYEVFKTNNNIAKESSEQLLTLSYPI